MHHSPEPTLEQAVQALLANTQGPAAAETLPLLDAIGRVAAVDQVARIDQPPFDRSPLDGYAVLHADVAGASAEGPAALRVVQHLFAGDAPSGPIGPGQAARIMTGAPMPPGATCVVRQEDTDGGKETVCIFVAYREHENYCWQGEDVRRGAPLVRAGQQLDAAALSVLAGQGLTALEVFPRPGVGVLSTGSELASAGVPLQPGKIYDSNRIYLAARIGQLGGACLPAGNAADEPGHIARAVQALLERCDLVVTTGGVSVGAHDYMPQVGQAMGATHLFTGIGLKPGGRALAYALGGKLLLCLSGNPFASAATFEVLAVPVIRKLCGHGRPLLERAEAILENGYPKPSPRRRLLRAQLRGGAAALPREGHSPGMMASMLGCNCLVDVPAGTPPLKAGMRVEVMLLA